MDPIEIEVTAEYRTQAPLGFCHIHDMGGSMITLWDSEVCEMIHRPSEGRFLVKLGNVPMLSAERLLRVRHVSVY